MSHPLISLSSKIISSAFPQISQTIEDNIRALLPNENKQKWPATAKAYNICENLKMNQRQILNLGKPADRTQNIEKIINFGKNMEVQNLMNKFRSDIEKEKIILNYRADFRQFSSATALLFRIKGQLFIQSVIKGLEMLINE